MAEENATKQSTALARIDTQALLLKAIESNAGIETMERLVALAKDMKAQMAREAWYEAMAAFQRECPAIKKTREATIPTRGGGGFSYSYAPLDEIVAVVQPILGAHGLSVSWRTRLEANQVIACCRISHVLGHSEDSGDTHIPIVQGDGGANPMQRVGIATTYARRYSLVSVLGLAPEDDDDGQAAPSRAKGKKTPAGKAEPSDPEPETPAADERAVKLAAIKETATTLGLSTDARQKLWTEYCGTGRAETVDLSALDALLSELRGRLPKGEGA